MNSFPLGSNPFPVAYEVLRSITLQMTSMEGGNNKFYVLELHEGSGNKYRLYSCYGRTGSAGTKEERFPDSRAHADKEFDSILKSKNKKGYHEVKMASTSCGSDEGNKQILSTDVAIKPTTSAAKKTNLAPQIIELVQTLYSEAGQACQSQLSGRLSTSTRNPLGTLTLSQIKEGKEVLQKINQMLTASPGLINNLDSNIISLSNEFYSVIPQEIPLRPKDTSGRDRWMRQYCLNRPSILDEKSDLLDMLADVQGMIQGFGTDDIQEKYNQIGCKYEIATPGEFKRIKDFVVNTQSSHHRWSLNVKSVYKINVKAQESYRRDMDQIGNIQELFHGSRNGNILGISKHGLLLRPPGAYVTGSMFGNGLYFADQSTKSSQYSTARFGGSSGSAGKFFMFVADVALGNIKKLTHSDSSLRTAPHGYHSVQGVKGPSLLHNEFIVYSVRQNQLQYLVEFTQ